MNFTYDFANGTTEIVYHPEKKRIPDPEMVEKNKQVCISSEYKKSDQEMKALLPIILKGKLIFLHGRVKLQKKHVMKWKGRLQTAEWMYEYGDFC